MRPWCLPIALLVSVACAQPAWGWVPAIRSDDALVRSLLDEGRRQSPTFRQLADDIGRTDGIVYISLGLCRVRGLRGCLLHTIEHTANARYLWIRIGNNSDEQELLATMAHELQHALEVLSRPDIRSRRDVLDFYLSLESRAFSAGSNGGPHRSYETAAAIDISSMVRAELSAAGADVTAADRD